MGGMGWRKEVGVEEERKEGEGEGEAEMSALLTFDRRQGCRRPWCCV